MARVERLLAACLAIVAIVAMAAIAAVAAPPATRYETLSPPQRQALLRRMAEWDALPLAQRRERRERWQAWQALPADERLRVVAAAAAYARLADEQRVALRRQFDALDGSARHGWLLGPALGADFAALQPLVSLVPADEREPLLDTLRAMSPQQRKQLAVLAQRTPPQDRDELRRTLLSTSDANRDAWLRQRLER